MDIRIVFAWFYYSSYYIAISILVTLFLNRLSSKLWLAPLIVNAICAVVLIGGVKLGVLSETQATYGMYFNYLPVVITSILTNLSIYIARKLKKRK